MAALSIGKTRHPMSLSSLENTKKPEDLAHAAASRPASDLTVGPKN
jgi:hypothetical protein